MNKTINHKAWFFVLPVVVLVAFNAIIPLMTVVNFSVQETFGDNVFFWAGVTWFEQVLHSPRFHDALLRQILFTAIILLIEVPLGLIVALAMPRKGPWVSVCLVTMALPLLESMIPAMTARSCQCTRAARSITSPNFSRIIRSVFRSCSLVVTDRSVYFASSSSIAFIKSATPLTIFCAAASASAWLAIFFPANAWDVRSTCSTRGVAAASF